MYYLRITDYADEFADLARRARVARAGQDDAAQLERPQRRRDGRVPLRPDHVRRRHRRRAWQRGGHGAGRCSGADVVPVAGHAAGLHDARGHADGRVVRGDRRRASARRLAREGSAGAPRLHRRVRPGRRGRGRHGHAREKGDADALPCHASPDRPAGARVDRQLRADELWRGCRHGRARARRARLRVREEVRPADQAGDPAGVAGERPGDRGRGGRRTGSVDHGRAGRRHDRHAARRRHPVGRMASRVRRDRHLRAFGHLRRHGLRDRGRGHRTRSRGQGLRREDDHVAPARLGHQPSALLGHADPDHPLPAGRRRRVRCRAGAGGRPAGRAARGPRARRDRQSIEEERRVPRLHLPCVQQAGGARDRHDGHVRRLGLVLHALLLARCEGRRRRRVDGRRTQRILDADGPVHRRHRARDPAPALRALLDQGHARPEARHV